MVASHISSGQKISHQHSIAREICTRAANGMTFRCRKARRRSAEAPVISIHRDANDGCRRTSPACRAGYQGELTKVEYDVVAAGTVMIMGKPCVITCLITNGWRSAGRPRSSTPTWRAVLIWAAHYNRYQHRQRWALRPNHVGDWCGDE